MCGLAPYQSVLSRFVYKKESTIACFDLRASSCNGAMVDNMRIFAGILGKNPSPRWTGAHRQNKDCSTTPSKESVQHCSTKSNTERGEQLEGVRLGRSCSQSSPGNGEGCMSSHSLPRLLKKHHRRICQFETSVVSPPAGWGPISSQRPL